MLLFLAACQPPVPAPDRAEPAPIPELPPPAPAASTPAPAAASWIPSGIRGWKHEATVDHDFDGDGRTDRAVVLTAPQPRDEEDRYLVVGLGTENGYRLVLESPCLAMCQTCGGVFGDPFAGMALIGKRSLRVSNYGGSAWRWSSETTLAWREGHMAVVGYDSSSFHTSEPEKVDEKSLNLLTGRATLNGEPRRHGRGILRGDDCEAIGALGSTELKAR